jgi:hypothetical protein
MPCQRLPVRFPNCERAVCRRARGLPRSRGDSGRSIRLNMRDSGRPVYAVTTVVPACFGMFDAGIAAAPVAA